MANVAQLAKIGGKMVIGNTYIWANVFRGKYFKDQNLMDCVAKPVDLPTWKGIYKIFNFVKGSYEWRLGNGSQISLWFDTWLDFEPLCFHVEDIDPNEIMWYVADIISPHGEWNLEILNTQIPSHLRNKIRNLHLHGSEEENTIMRK